MHGQVQKKWSLLLFLLTSCLSCWLPSMSQSNGGAVQQYACNRAAVVMIRTEVLAEVNVQKINFNPKTFNRLLDSIHQPGSRQHFLNSCRETGYCIRRISKKTTAVFCE